MQAGIGKTCFLLNWSTVDVFFIRLSKMGEREVHGHQSTFLEPPDRRKTLVSPTGTATCSL